MGKTVTVEGIELLVEERRKNYNGAGRNGYNKDFKSASVRGNFKAKNPVQRGDKRS